MNPITIKTNLLILYIFFSPIYPRSIRKSSSSVKRIKMETTIGSGEENKAHFCRPPPLDNYEEDLYGSDIPRRYTLKRYE